MKKRSDYKIRISEWILPIKGFFNYSERINRSEESAKPSLLKKYPSFAFYNIIVLPLLYGGLSIGFWKGLEALLR